MAHVVLDKDGVMANFLGGFAAYLRAKGHHHDYPTPTEYNFAHQWDLTPEQFQYQMLEFAADRGYRDLDPIGDLTVLYGLVGHRVTVATKRFSRPQHRGIVAGDSLNWLWDHNVSFDNFALVQDKDVVDGDIFVDDAPSNILALRAAGKRAIIFDQPWNRSLKGERVFNLGQFVDLVNS